MKNIKILLTASCLLLISSAYAQNGDSKSLEIIKNVVEANGGKDKFYKNHNISYSYLYKNKDGRTDFSEEKYIFKNEISWGEYSYSDSMIKDQKGNLIQFFDGKNTSVYLNGKKINDKQLNRKSDFLRKTNYYWFSMMFKLLDPGTNYKFLSEESIDNNLYDKIELTYDKNIGDVSDKYLLFVNKESNLIDFFLFSVMDFNIIDPLVMKVEYEKIDGLMLPTKRKYSKAKSWEDYQSINNEWTYEISSNIKFNDKFNIKDLKNSIN